MDTNQHLSLPKITILLTFPFQRCHLHPKKGWVNTATLTADPDPKPMATRES